MGDETKEVGKGDSFVPFRELVRESYSFLFYHIFKLWNDCCLKENNLFS